MSHELDDLDIGIVSSLQQDGRKSFRQIAREINPSTPTAQARYQRLVNIGLIKSISPIIDSDNIIDEQKGQIQTCDCHESNHVDLKSGMFVKIKCDLCNGVIGNKPHVLKFASFGDSFAAIHVKPNTRKKTKDEYSQS